VQLTTVTSKGQVTIPKSVRQKLGICQGSQVEFVVIGDKVELHIVSQPAIVPLTGFGLLKSTKAPVAADVDPAQWAKNP
jgi:AbrB family looped-hinge helix DNA binding protein